MSRWNPSKPTLEELHTHAPASSCFCPGAVDGRSRGHGGVTEAELSNLLPVRGADGVPREEPQMLEGAGRCRLREGGLPYGCHRGQAQSIQGIQAKLPRLSITHCCLWMQRGRQLHGPTATTAVVCRG